jgi:hypothetical protein
MIFTLKASGPLTREDRIYSYSIAGLGIAKFALPWQDRGEEPVIVLPLMVFSMDI